MLIEFSVSNFRSFNEEQTLSLVAGRDRKHPENLIAKSGLRLLKAAAIYGANASGKSSLIKALDVLVDAVRFSATRLTEGDRIPGIVPFRLNSQTPEKPSRFAVKFLKEGDLYEYSLAATSRRVHEESLSRSCIGKKPEVWFTRRFQHQTQSHEWSFSGPLKEDERAVLRDRTRDNGLALSRGAEQNIKPLSDVFSAFTQFWVFDLSSSPQHLLQVTARRMIQNDVFARRILALVRDADFDIRDLSVKEVPLDGKKLSLFRRILSAPELKDLKDLNEKELLETDIRASHLVRDTGSPVQFRMEEESNGTMRFFSIAGPLVDALEKGSVVIVDEFDCSMHPLLTQKLLQLVQSETANQTGAQLIFTTHDSSLMTPDLFRRDQVWLVEKRASGASRLLSLYDFKKPPRSTESFQRNYLTGRYGAVPNFGPTLEDQVLK